MVWRSGSILTSRVVHATKTRKGGELWNVKRRLVGVGVEPETSGVAATCHMVPQLLPTGIRTGGECSHGIKLGGLKRPRPKENTTKSKDGNGGPALLGAGRHSAPMFLRKTDRQLNYCGSNQGVTHRRKEGRRGVSL